MSHSTTYGRLFARSTSFGSFILTALPLPQIRPSEICAGFVSRMPPILD